jgi:hypothetical protein
MGRRRRFARVIIHYLPDQVAFTMMQSRWAAGAGEIIRDTVVGSATKQHHHHTINMADQRPPDVPKELRSMIQLNTAYSVLICPDEWCRKAVQPSAFTRHSYEDHGATIRARRELEAFIKGLKWKGYDSQTVVLPPDGREPQPTIPVSDGVECRFCIAESRQPTFKTRKQKSMRKIMKAHGNKVHKQNKVPDNKLYREVRVQTWFRGNGEARYWRVEEQDGVAEEAPVIRGGSGMAGAIDGEGTGATDKSTNTIASAREPANTRGEEAVIVIDSNDDDFIRQEEVPIRAAEGDNRDESVSTPEKESTATAVVIDSDDELLVPRRRPTRPVEAVSNPQDDIAAAGVIIIGSDDGALVPRSRGDIKAVKVDSSDESDGDADYIPSSEEVSSDDEGCSSDAGNGEARQSTAVKKPMVITPRPRKRKAQPPSTTTMDSDDGPYPPPSPRFDGPSPKRQRQRSPFVDSGVAIPPSSEHAHDEVAHHSSTPIKSWTIPTQADVQDGVPDAGRAAYETTRATCRDPERAPSPVRFAFGRPQPALDVLQGHLKIWCEACPSCVSETDVERGTHHIEGCWRADTVDIIKSARVMQQHIEERGGFGGRVGCPRCGVPRTICQRWRMRPGGGGWEERTEEACQYGKRLTAAVITMLMDGCPEGWAVTKEWMTRAGVRLNKQDEVYEWFRGPAWWADTGMEVSQIVRVFHMLAGKNGKVVRR